MKCFAMLRTARTRVLSSALAGVLVQGSAQRDMGAEVQGLDRLVQVRRQSGT